MKSTREIGILKSLGASKFYIVNVVLRETLVLAIAAVLRRGSARRWPLVTSISVASPMLASAAIVKLLVGAIYPAYKAAQELMRWRMSD